MKKFEYPIIWLYRHMVLVLIGVPLISAIGSFNENGLTFRAFLIILAVVSILNLIHWLSIVRKEPIGVEANNNVLRLKFALGKPVDLPWKHISEYQYCDAPGKTKNDFGQKEIQISSSKRTYLIISILKDFKEFKDVAERNLNI